MKKFVSFVLVCLLLISSFSFGAFGSSSLVSSDLSKWNQVTEVGGTYWGFGQTKYNPDMYQCVITSTTSGLLSYSYWTDVSNLSTGSDYTLSFRLPSGSEYYEATLDSAFKNENWYDSWVKSTGATLIIGFSHYFDNDVGTYVIDYDNFPSFTVTVDDIASQVGKNQRFSFTCPEYTGELFMVISFMFTDVSNAGNPVIVISDFSLVDNEKSFFAEQFDRLTNLILYFDADGNYTNPFDGSDSPLYYISEYFDNLINYVSESVESITTTIDSASGMIHIFDLFTKRFGWLLGLCVFTLAVLVYCRFIGL